MSEFKDFLISKLRRYLNMAEDEPLPEKFTTTPSLVVVRKELAVWLLERDRLSRMHDSEIEDEEYSKSTLDWQKSMAQLDADEQEKTVLEKHLKELQAWREKNPGNVFDDFIARVGADLKWTLAAIEAGRDFLEATKPRKAKDIRSEADWYVQFYEKRFEQELRVLKERNDLLTGVLNSLKEEA